MDYPPIWILGKRYRIFPGVNDRSYEYWKQTVRYFFGIKDEFIKKFNYDPVTIIQQLLELQTSLVEIIEKKHTSCKKVDTLWVPSLELVTDWHQTIDKWKHTVDFSFYQKYSIKFGELQIPTLVELEPLDTIYKVFSVGPNHSLIFPHTFHGFLSILLDHDHDEIKEEISEILIQNLKYHLMKKLCTFFSMNEMIPEFSLKNTERYDFGVFFDNNKLFLFKIIHLDLISDLETVSKNLFEDVKNMETKISNGETEFYYKDKQIGDLPHTNIEIIPILLFETIKITSAIELPRDNYIQTKYVWFGFFMDFMSMLEEFDDFMMFLKFLRRKKFFLDKIEIHAFNSLDLFAHYLQNRDSFLEMGKLPHFMSFIPGYWDKFKVKQIKKRPDFQARYNDNKEDDFWILKATDDKLFQVHHPIIRNAATVFLLPSDRSIWIMAMDDEGGYVENEIHCMDSLTQLIPHRFIQNEIFDTFLEKLKITSNQKIYFSLVSTTMIKKRKMYHMESLLPLISKKTPLIVSFVINPEGGVIFYFVYSPEYFLSFLSEDPMNAEKYIIHQLLNDICKYAKMQDCKSIVKQCSQKLFDDVSVAFSFTQVPLRVGTAQHGTDYTTTLESDISETNRIIGEFLMTLNITPGVYEKEKAKEILNKIFEFLKKKFIQKISTIEQKPLLLFLMYSEGQIMKERILQQKLAKHESQFDMEYDPIARYSERNEEMNTLSEVYRYAIEITVKHWSEGTHPFLMEDWLELQALAEKILFSSFLSSYLFFGLSEYRFHIFEDYSFNVESKNTIDLENFGMRFDKSFVTYEKPTVNYHTTEQTKKLMYELNEPFKDEFGINCEDFSHIIEICLLYLKEKQRDTLIISDKYLLKFGKKYYPHLSLESLHAGLDMWSLTKKNMDHEFYPSDTRNRPYRHGCRPIIKFPDNEHYLISSWAIDNVQHRFWSEIDQGYLLYNENFISSKKLKLFLQNLRDKADKSHEKSIEQLFQTKTNLTVLNLKNDNSLLSNIDDTLPGEIDLLAIFPKSKELYLIEAKNIKMSYASRDMSNELKAFIKKDIGYIAKFLHKIGFIKEHLSEILDYYNISNKENWKMYNYFVTSNVTFLQQNNSQYKFITLEELKNIISKY